MDKYTKHLENLPFDLLHIAQSFANDNKSPKIEPAHLLRLHQRKRNRAGGLGYGATAMGGKGQPKTNRATEGNSPGKEKEGIIGEDKKGAAHKRT